MMQRKELVGFAPSILNLSPVYVNVQRPNGEIETTELSAFEQKFSSMPLVSCLMVCSDNTRFAEFSVQCYLRQNYSNRELIVLYISPDPQFEASLKRFDHAGVKLVGVRHGFSLGELRNISVAHAKGELLCQWDAADLYDPSRLALSVRALLSAKVDAGFSSHVLLWSPGSSALAVSQRRIWNSSMLIWRNVLPIYPALSEGDEDKFVMSHITRRCSLALLNEPYLYCHVVTSNDDRSDVDLSDARHVYRNETYGEALKLFAQRTPAREYAAAFATRVSQSTSSQGRK